MAEISDEAKITSHHLLAAFDEERRGLEVLHQDLFDSSTEVVLSALEALARLREERSVQFVARLLERKDELVRSAAARTLGTIGSEATVGILTELFRLTRNEGVRCAALAGLAAAAPRDPAVVALIEEQATSRLVPATMRGCAAEHLVQVKGSAGITALLSLVPKEEIEKLYWLGRERPEVLPAIITHGLASYDSLPTSARGALVSVTTETPEVDSGAVILKGISDPQPAVRKLAYSAIGRDTRQLLLFPNLILRLMDHREPHPALEEEILSALSRIELVAGIGSTSSTSTRTKLLDETRRLYAELAERQQSSVSDAHELGWLMTRAREYLEYYASEEFRAALLGFLRGSTEHSANELISFLKASAVRVEARHLDGFRALVEIIRDPKRHGMALVGREIAGARLGARDLFNRLVRNLRMTRLIDGVGTEQRDLFLEIVTWAREARLFRLAEGALYALARVDAAGATRICRELIRNGQASKILTIASIRLLTDLRWEEMESAVIEVLRSSKDDHVLLNLIDALASAKLPTSPEILKTMVAILHNGRAVEVVQRVSGYLALQPASSLLDDVMQGFEICQPWRQEVILSLVERKVTQEGIESRSGLSEILYRILRGGTGSARPLVAVLLLRLGDSYAEEILKDILAEPAFADHVAVVQHLKGAIARNETLDLLVPLLSLGNPVLHEALRETLLAVEETGVQRHLCDLLLALRGASAIDGDELPAAGETAKKLEVDLLKEKKAYRFEREHIQEMAILFSDIQGYSKKAQALSSLQLTSLIQDYENILGPMMSEHRGELIKRMGDGHLFVFSSAIDAVLAAIRMQKALKRYNGYREEEFRLTIRIGIHWGRVVQKDGDVLGNHVNIASRLEGSARGGSILISEAAYERLEGHILCNEIGMITVKNISEPIRVFEPYEIALQFPEQLDPLKTAREKTAEVPPAGELSQRPESTVPPAAPAAPSEELHAYLNETFSHLNRLCLRLERQELDPRELRSEIQRRWRTIRAMTGRDGSSPAPQEEPSTPQAASSEPQPPAAP